MRYRALTTILTSAALVIVPTAGLAQGAPQPAPSRESGLRFAETDDDDDDDVLWYVLGGIAVMGLIFLLFLDDDDDEDLPFSP